MPKTFFLGFSQNKEQITGGKKSYNFRFNLLWSRQKISVLFPDLERLPFLATNLSWNLSVILWFILFANPFYHFLIEEYLCLDNMAHLRISSPLFSNSWIFYYVVDFVRQCLVLFLTQWDYSFFTLSGYSAAVSSLGSWTKYNVSQQKVFIKSYLTRHNLPQVEADWV